MALSLYCGIMGSGKSYELVSQVVLPALKDGRRVVTNIEGLDPDKISHFLDKDVHDLLVFVSDTDPLEPSFWYHPETNKTATTQPGDLLVLDEAWRMFPAGDKLDPAILEYFRKHRHYTDASGVATDIALAFQLFTDIHRALRGVAAVTVETRKMTMLGRPKNYRVRIYEGAANPQQRSVQPVALHVRKYDPAIFPLYSSFAAKKGVEKKSGRTATLWSNSLLVFWLPLCLLVLAWGGWYSYRTFMKPMNDALASEQKGGSLGSSASTASGALSKSGGKGTPVPTAVTVSSSSTFPSTAQFTGWYLSSVGERIFVFTVDGHLRYATHRDFNRVIDYGNFIAFELRDGTLLSEVYRPAIQKQDASSSSTSRGSQNAQLSSSGVGSPAPSPAR